MDAATGKVGHSDGEPAHELLGLHKHCIFNAQGIYTRMQQKLARCAEQLTRSCSWTSHTSRWSKKELQQPDSRSSS